MSNESRHGKRATGKTQTSISMREDLLEAAKRQAETEGRSLSNWIEQMLKERFPESVTPPLPTSAKRGKK
ncbi:DUF6364 family protein [Luteolibacter sp. LG18]|uniref:DUF6364 family protein n=1 Tax=Luteolibacter sp. LG18 TaxID=2819286 RepID=UPI002B2F9CCB|nr:hypothetical protein llg_41420 [Luteolibacter sp. LG18]